MMPIIDSVYNIERCSTSLNRLNDKYGAVGVVYCSFVRTILSEVDREIFSSWLNWVRGKHGALQEWEMLRNHNRER